MRLPPEHQTLDNQAGEVAFRRRAAFGEPDKVLEIARDKLATRRAVFEQLRDQGVALGPFLELGADVAHTAVMLHAEFGVDGAAVDISRDALGAAPVVAIRLGYQDLPLRICCDAGDLPFVDGALAFVYCFQTLHHFANPAPVIREVVRVLRDGGHFYFAEEPVRRWLCLNLYRCDRPENLTGLNRWLWDHHLLRYIAEAHVGSREETEWGIVENQQISLRQWERLLSVFGTASLDVSRFGSRAASLVSEWLRRARVPGLRADRVVANLFGTSLSGLCRAAKAGGRGVAEGTPVFQRCRCPDCHEGLRWDASPTPRFVCPGCGPFPHVDGVHMLFRRRQYDVLYAGKPTQTIADAIREGRSPHELVPGAAITEVWLLDAAGNPVRQVRSGEATTVDVRIEFARLLDNPAVGLVIRRSLHGEPTVVYDTNTIWRNQETGQFRPGDVGHVRYRQRMELGRGQYTITTAIASRDGRTFYDWREAALRFEVIGAQDMQGIANLRSVIEVDKTRGPAPTLPAART